MIQLQGKLFFVFRMSQSLSDEITGNLTSIMVRLGLRNISDSDISSSCTGLKVNAVSKRSKDKSISKIHTKSKEL